jgi:hypothetical protein
MIAAATVVAQVLCCLGFGAAVLRALGVWPACNVERLAWAFGLGMGILGWIVFLLGVIGAFDRLSLLMVFVAGLAGCFLLRHTRLSGEPLRLSSGEIVLLAVLAIPLGFDLVEALAPPADADTLAYHFALPKQFIAAGRLEFVPRALDGAMPLLIHMTYVPPLAIGGEQALTLWAMASGWAMIVLTYTTARRFVERPWALASALLLATTPAVVYVGGSGHMEARLAVFAVLAAIALSDAIETADHRFAAVAGLAAGFFAGAKYTGLFFGLACAIVLVGLLLYRRRPWLRTAMVMAVAATVAAVQPYVWNWVNSGDPLFPLFYGILPYHDPSVWSAEHAAQLRDYTALQERGVPVNALWLLAYPFVATFGGPSIFESGRTGFGPFVFLVLPMAILAAWMWRRKLLDSRLTPLALVTALFYAIWFLSGVSQRSRHLLPVYPLLLVVMLACAERWTMTAGTPLPLVAAAAVTLSLQLAGHLVFARSAVQHVFTGEDRDGFLMRTVNGYPAVAWINQHLGSHERVFTVQRQLIYLFDIPVYYGHIVQDGRVDLRPEADDPSRYLAQLRAAKVTHILATHEGDPPYRRTGDGQWRALESSGCLALVRTFSIPTLASRALPSLGRGEETWGLHRIDANGCKSETLPDVRGP